MIALRCNDEIFEPRVRRTPDGLDVSVGDRSFRLALDPVSDGEWLVRQGDRVAVLHLVRDGDTIHLAWEGVAYRLLAEREGTRRSHRHEASALEAPMPGRVAAVKTAPGQKVVRGQELLVVEAMKMENALRAPRDGVVRAVHAAVGDMVAPGRALVELEP